MAVLPVNYFGWTVFHRNATWYTLRFCTFWLRPGHTETNDDDNSVRQPHGEKLVERMAHRMTLPGDGRSARARFKRHNKTCEFLRLTLVVVVTIGNRALSIRDWRYLANCSDNSYAMGEREGHPCNKWPLKRYRWNRSDKLFDSLFLNAVHHRQIDCIIKIRRATVCAGSATVRLFS